jgi:hypothetical protein
MRSRTIKKLELHRQSAVAVPRGSVRWCNKDQLCKGIARQNKLAKIKQLQWNLSLRGKRFAEKMRKAFIDVGSRDLNYEQYRKCIEEIIGDLVLTQESMVSSKVASVQNETDNSLTVDFFYCP